jgi:hypothetical protein
MSPVARTRLCVVALLVVAAAVSALVSLTGWEPAPRPTAESSR